MTDKDIKDLVKEIPELDKAWEKFQSEKSESQRETEVEMYRYRMLRERESRKESLPEPEFTKAKRAEQTSEVTTEVTSEISELDIAARKYAGIPEDSPHDLKYCVQDKKAKYDAVLFGANLAKQQMMKGAVDGIVEEPVMFQWRIVSNDLDGEFVVNNKLTDGDKVKLIIINED